MRRIIFVLFLTFSSLFAQDPNWSSTLIFPSYPSPYISDWERNPDVGTLSLNYFGTTTIQFYQEVIITIDGYGEAIRGKTATREYTGPTSEMLTFNDFSNWEEKTYNKDLERLVIQTGKLPESSYTICVNTYALNGDLLTEGCAYFDISLPNPPQLISPEDEGSIQISQPTFMWSPVSTPPSMEVFYKVKIVELLKGQTAFRAMEANVPVVEAENEMVNTYVYRIDDYLLEQNHTYAWQIQAINDEGVPVSTNEGFSEIWQFTYGSPAGEIGVDTLMLVEDFAYLIDLDQLDITDNKTFLNLDGSCRMLVKGIDGIDKFIDVFAQNLMLQKDEESYDNPIFLGGSVLGSIYDEFISKDITGEFFKPTELEFIPPNQLTIGGDFYINEDVDIPLTGKLSYIDKELSGSLTLSGTPEVPVFSFGDDLFKTNITFLSISYPEIETTLQGGLSLFGSASSCELSDLTLNKSGVYSASISCDVSQEIPLMQGSTMFNLRVDKVEGSVSGNLVTNNVDYTVDITGGMLFKMLDENSSVDADIAFRLKPDDFKLISFTPSANLSTASLDFGWLKWNLDNLKLNDLSYQNKHWDFDLSMDIDISFPDFTLTKLPTIHDISFTPGGFVFPKINFDNFSIPNIDFAGFSLDLYGFSTPGFTFDLSKWNPGSIAKMVFDWKVKFNMPNLPSGTDNGFKLPNWDFDANITDGNFDLKFPDMDFPHGFDVPIPGNLIMKIKSLAGGLNTDFDGTLMSFLPNVKIGGTVQLPEALRCSQDNGEITLSNIKLNGNGTFNGIIENFIPKCPIDIGLASLYMKDSKLEFKEDNGQKILLSGSAGVKFTNDEKEKEVGEIKVVYEIINNNLIKAEGKISEEFKWDLPTENPVFSFALKEASISDKVLTIDGRSNLNLPGNEEMGVSFDKFQIDLNDYSIKDGRIIFDQPFAFAVDGLESGNLHFAAVSKGDIPKTESFLYLELPDKIKLDKNGLSIEGESKTSMKFGGKDLDDLSAKFSKDFAFSLMPFKVTSGKCEIFYQKDKVAYFNSTGFYPNPNYFLNKVLPEKLPLPTLQIAYLQLKQNNTLLVNVSQEGNSTRISTRPNEPIQLVFPSLKFNSAEDPKILVNFSIAIDDVTGRITDGFIEGIIPEASAHTFDLSRVGIPYAIHSVYYGNINGVDQFRLSGQVKAFENELGCDSLKLNITQAGILQGHADCNLAKTIQLIPDEDKLNLTINKITGDFNVDLISSNFDFSLELDSDLRFIMSDAESFGIWTNLGLSKDGVRLLDSRIDSLAIPKIDLSQFKLGLENLNIGKLTYSKTPNDEGITGWDFEFGMDLDFEFPEMDFRIPKIPNVILNRTGFHTMSQISIPSFADSLKFQFNGIELKPLAFRMPKLDFNWFDPVGSVADWGFQFDFEVNFPNLADASGAMKFPHLTILNAGFIDGIFTGSIEPVTFTEDDGLNLNFGNAFGFSIRSISGGLINENGAQGVGIKFKGDFKLPEFMRCDGQSPSVRMGNAEFSLNSLGQVNGEVQNFVPTCPVDLGFGKFNVTTSALQFAVSSNQQTAVLDMTGNLVVNTGNNSTVTANGALKLNLLTGEVIDGEIGINQQFVWGIPSDNPVLNFTINSAVLNKDGLKINGASSLKLPNNQTQSATFNNLVFDYRKLKVKSGSLDINGGFALKLAVIEGGLDWSVIQPDAPLTEDKTAKIGFSSNLTLDSTGISVSGEAVASIRWDNDPSHQFGDIRITYSNDFKFSISPFKVAEGHADLIYNNNVIASLTHDGLTLGNVFGILPVPELIPLPSIDVAYLRIKSGDQLLIQSETVEAGLRVYTTQDNPVSLVLPALKYGGAEVDSIPTVFDVVINPSSGELVSGQITLAKEDSTSLLNLKDRGIPIDIFKLEYKNSGGGYALTADANISIPNILNGLPLKLRKLRFTNSGIAGTINLGTYSETYRNNISPIALTSIGSEAIMTLEGIDVEFGATNSFGFSGKFIPKMLINGNDTTKIHYASSWNNSDKKFNFSFDFANGELFDFGVGTFRPISLPPRPAMKLSLMEDNFELLLNGEFKANDLGDDFAITIEGLKITKNSVSADDISRPANNPLRFDMFNSNFKIYDKSQQSKAIRFAYNDGVLTLTLSGDLEIFDHTTSFSDFSIGTDGTLSLGSVNFIAGGDLTIVDNYLALNNLGIVNDDNKYKLSVGGWIKLPEPIGSENSQFDFGFNIAPDGTITQNAQLTNRLIFINENQQLGHGDETEYDMWKAKFDLTYLALELNFDNIQSSAIKMVGDIYWDNSFDKRLEIGDKSNANNVIPGLTINFNGDVTWGSANLHGEFGFEVEMLKVGISSVQLSSDVHKNLTIGIDGSLGLNFDAVSGGLSLAGFKFNQTGIVDVGHITEGSLSIDGVGSLKLNAIEFRNSPSQIWVKKTESGNGPDSTQITVNSYLKFGGEVTITGLGSGGVDQFLTYTTDNSFTLVIKNAHFEVAGTMKASMDLIYYTGSDGFLIRAGGKADIQGTGMIVLGKIAKINNQVSFGFFLAASVRIDITPVVITGIGGGFFYNPTADDINTVKRLADVGTKAKNKVAVQGGRFAVFLYGQAAIASDVLISGRVLITITDNQFMLDGRMILLSQENRIEGGMHLLVQWSPEFAAEGVIEVDVTVPYVVEGSGRMGFYVFGTDQWAIYGETELKLFKYINSSSDFFVGPSGFMIGMSASVNFDIWIIEVGAGIDVKVWYLTGQNASWGAYAEAYVKAEILWGVVKAKGWLKCALINSNNHTFLYGQAGMEIHTWIKDWSGSVWAKIDNGDISGGRGSDSDMDALIAEAAGQSQQAEQEMNDMKNSVENRPQNGASFSEDDLKTAFSTLTSYGSKYKYGNAAERAEAQNLFNELRSVENMTYRFSFSFVDFSFPHYTPVIGETRVYNWVINQVYKAPDAPNLDGYNTSRQSIQSVMQEYEDAKSDLLPLFDDALNSVAPVEHNLNQTASDPTAGTQFASYTYDENGNYVVTNTPSMNLDEDLANSNQSNLEDGINSVQQYRESVYAEYNKIKDNINKIERVLRGSSDKSGSRGAENLSRSYASVIETIHGTYLQEYIYYKQVHSWAKQLRQELSAGYNSLASIMRNKAIKIYNSNFATGYYMLAALNVKRIEEIAKLSGEDVATISQKSDQEKSAWINNASINGKKAWAINRSKSVGVQLWRSIPAVGLDDLKARTRNMINTKLEEKYDNLHAMGQTQAEFTGKMNILYNSLSSLSETEYDILTKLVEWENEPRPIVISTINKKGRQRKRFSIAKRVLEEKMTVPIISTLSATNIDLGICARTTIGWNISGPRRRKVTFMIDYDSRNPNIARNGFQAIGNRSSVVLFYTPRLGRTSFGVTNFTLKARNEVGYTIHKSISFTPTFSNTSNIQVGGVTTTNAARDLTPPVITQVTYPYTGHLFQLQGNENTNYYTVQYLGDSTRISANWIAHDNESGIQEYRYKLVRSSLPTAMNQSQFQIGYQISNVGNITLPGNAGQQASTAAVNPYKDWTNNYGRDNVVINGLDLHDGEVYQVRVAAKNGDGVWTDNFETEGEFSYFAGKYIYIKVDLTPPPPPVAMPLQHVFYMNYSPNNSYTLRGSVELPEGAENSGTQFISVPSNNSFAHSLSPMQIGSLIGGAGIININQTFVPTFSVASYMQLIQYYDNSNASIRVNYAVLPDEITGQSYPTEVRISSAHNDTVTTNWFRNTGSYFENSTPELNNILSYLDSFYVDVRCVDLAGNRSPITRFAVQPYDQTPPTKPIVNFAYSSNKQRAYLVFDSQSSDPECGVKFYEVGVGSSNRNISFADSIRFTPSDISNVHTVLLPQLPERNRTIIAVRAVNTQGTRGPICYTGYYYQDNTPPERPTVIDVNSYIDNRKIKHLTFGISNLVDNESRIDFYEYRVLKGRPNTTIWLTAKQWTTSRPNSSYKNLLLSSLNLHSGDRIKIQARANNKLGMVSPVGEVVYEIPDFTPPIIPDVVIASGSSRKRGPKMVGLTFSNISDPESGISQVKYKIYKASNSRTIRKSYSAVSSWITSSSHSRVSFLYSKYRLRSGETLKIEIKTKNNAGLWSQTRSRTHTLK